MPIQPAEIQQKKFASSRHGYEPKQVDEFLAEITADYEQLLLKIADLIDENAERQRDKDDVAAGLMQKWEYRVKWYGETEEDAKKALADGEPTDDDLMGFGQEGLEEGED